MTVEDRFKLIRQQLDRGETPEPVTVKTLLSWFDAERRGLNVVFLINLSLDEYGLATKPDFEVAYIHSKIEFIKKEDRNTTNTSTTTTTTIDPKTNIASGVDDIYFDDPTYRIGKLDAANKDLVSVNPDSEISEAITQMLAYDYSQLPVMQQAKRGLKGVITWRSIGKALMLNKKVITKVREAMEPNYQLLSDDFSLFKALPRIIEHDYVLIENSAKEISGIVTASDLSLQFQQLTEPFLLIAEIENHLRQILSKLPKMDLVNAKDEKDTERTIDSIHDLTFGEYIRLFQNPTYWGKLSLSIDRKTFCSHLEKVLGIRNDIMHFNPDPVGEETLETLRRVVRLLQAQRSFSSKPD